MSPPASHLRLVPRDPAALAPPVPGAPVFFTRSARLRPQADRHRLLGQILLDMQAVRPENLYRALTLRDTRAARLGDILLAHDWVSEADLMLALSVQWRARALDLLAERPDARLVDQIGAETCLAQGLIPWRQAGGATVIATSRPEEFERRRNGLEARFGPVMMALASERDIHAALLALRQTALVRKAETRVAAAESCRSLSARGAAAAAGLLVALVLLGFSAAPAATLACLTGWAILSLLALMGLKAATFLAVLTRGAPAPLPPEPGHLPIVSVMVPLFRETDIAPRLIRRIGRIDYPKELLDILLVVEEDDRKTQEALARGQLPRWMRVITVPTGTIRTKPRALNFALDFCRGSIIGIWDAEDAPDPGQIRTVVRKFAGAAPEVVCLQGILDFYNARHNWLTRCFAVEYASWFRTLLPGLARLGLVVPLGGTTLFFRREAIEDLGGWDAHNVTEDADLGLRLARRGYRTELIETVTHEEPNSRPVAWIRQRSRWQKGFAMTWASHMRDPLRLWRDLGPRRFLGVQVLFLGTLSQSVLAPVLWSYWLLALGLPHPLGPVLPHGAFVALGTVFLLSELLNIAVGLWATRAPEHRHLMKWVPTLHAYFPLAALSSYKALAECVTRPFYWDKTAHGIVGSRPEAQDLLPVLLLTGPVHLPEAVVPLRPSAPPFGPAAPARLHLGQVRPWAGWEPAEPAGAPPHLVLIAGGLDSPRSERAPYVLGSTLAKAPRHPGIEFQPSFEGF